MRRVWVVCRQVHRLAGPVRPPVPFSPHFFRGAVPRSEVTVTV